MATDTSFIVAALVTVVIGIFANSVLGLEDTEEEHLEPKAAEVPSCVEIYPCEPCDTLELQIHSSECAYTGYRHILKCQDGERDLLESCPNGLKSFWLFEVCMLLVGFVFGILTLYRRRHLNRLVKERIMEQIQNSA